MKKRIRKVNRIEIRRKLLEEYSLQIEKQMLLERKQELLIEKNVKKITRFCSVSERTLIKEGITNRKLINEGILSSLFSSAFSGSTDASKQSVATFLIGKIFGEKVAKGFLGLVAANFVDNLTMDAIKKVMAGDKVCETIADIVVRSILEALNEKYVIDVLLGDSAESGNLLVAGLARTLREMIANYTNDTDLISGLRSTVVNFICSMSFFGGAEGKEEKDGGGGLSLPDFGGAAESLGLAKFI